MERAVEHFGRLDILHNTAALLDLASLQQDGTVLDTPLEIWDQTMAVNVRGYAVACKHVIPHMRATGGGSIINTSSTEAEYGNFARIAYASSKGAVCTLTRYIATQHAHEGIRCNTIMPGLILDPALEAQVGGFGTMVQRHVLAGRNGRPEDIAATAAFLASDDSAFITGQEIKVDGGLQMHVPFYGEVMDQGGDDMLQSIWRESPAPR